MDRSYKKLKKDSSSDSSEFQNPVVPAWENLLSYVKLPAVGSWKSLGFSDARVSQERDNLRGHPFQHHQKICYDPLCVSIISEIQPNQGRPVVYFLSLHTRSLSQRHLRAKPCYTLRPSRYEGLLLQQTNSIPTGPIINSPLAADESWHLVFQYVTRNHRRSDIITACYEEVNIYPPSFRSIPEESGGLCHYMYHISTQGG